jgi:tetratricopeptide (TPR) repeat protein
LLTALLLTALSPAVPLRSSEPHWIRVDSSHFFVLTDADQTKGHEVITRFEQMRALFAQLIMKTRVNLPEPIEIIAFKAREEYEKVAPSRNGEGLGKGFFLSGDGRNYFVLNLAQEESWRAISYEFARLLLGFNYPPTQPWFDEGFAEYFSSAKIGDQTMEIGGDPEAHQATAGGTQGGQQSVGQLVGGQSFVEVLKSSDWQPLPQLFAARPGNAVNRHTLFCAQSWLTMHYLISNDKLSSAGTYFGLVETERLSVEDAIQKAFGMNAEQLAKAIKDYFQSLLEMLQLHNNPNAGKAPIPAPIPADQVGGGVHDIPEPTASALVAEMALRVPERREQARLELASLIDGAKTETAIAHRALGWYYLDKKDFEKANDELTKALALDNHDIWTHFYLALTKERQAKASGHPTQGLANTIQDLHVVLDSYPEFADAYAMLARAQLEGGGLRAATDSIRAATKLSPRNQSFLLELAQVYVAGKNWDAATAMLQLLSASPDTQIADSARAQLQDLPYIRKYGVPPLQAAAQPSGAPSPAPSPATPPAQKAPIPPAAQPAQEADNENTEEAPPEPQIDRRQIQYLKGRLIAVDCSQAPVALLTVSSGGKTMKLRTSDYKSLTLIGTDTFSCHWTDEAVSVNYKPGGKADGDLVSLELR